MSKLEERIRSDFLYYESNEQLRPMIQEITENWDNYKHIVDNAYEKAVNNYTSQQRYKMISEGR